MTGPESCLDRVGAVVVASWPMIVKALTKFEGTTVVRTCVNCEVLEEVEGIAGNGGTVEIGVDAGELESISSVCIVEAATLAKN